MEGEPVLQPQELEVEDPGRCLVAVALDVQQRQNIEQAPLVLPGGQLFGSLRRFECPQGKGKFFAEQGVGPEQEIDFGESGQQYPFKLGQTRPDIFFHKDHSFAQLSATVDGLE